MNIEALKQYLQGPSLTVVGFPSIPHELIPSCLEFFQWTLQGKPEYGRMIWFHHHNPKEFREQLSPFLRNRILPLSEEVIQWHLQNIPSDALLLPKESSNPNDKLSSFWRKRGSYREEKEFGLVLWKWIPKSPPIVLFGMDHHHAVLWDIKQTLRPLGIYLDFIWLCDGRPPVNEAIPGEAPPFKSSLDIYRSPVDKVLDSEFKERLKANYKGIMTSHSLVTAFRLREVELPQIHINSTRFGNDWISDSQKHSLLVNALQEMLRTNKLRVIHNNKGDLLYFHQFFPYTNHDECVIPSICENAMRKRFHTVNPMKFLIWDTRQVLLQQTKSPFMKELYFTCKEVSEASFDSQAVLLAEAKTYLPEGYLDHYTAVIHIPYNISTMSIFQQVTANIPIWVPSRSLLKRLWMDPDECNELSWTVFSKGSEEKASFLDQVRNPESLDCWLSSADFYDSSLSHCIFTFDSVEDLLLKIFTVNYQEAIEKNNRLQISRQENAAAMWEQLFRPLNST